MKDLQDKVAFITGGASGIGFGMARAFLRAGMRVCIADISAANLEDAGQRLQGVAAGAYRLLQLDVTDWAAVGRAALEVERAFGHLHVLCNNAGVGMAPPVHSAQYVDWDLMLGINLGGVVNGIVTFLPRLRAMGKAATSSTPPRWPGSSRCRIRDAVHDQQVRGAGPVRIAPAGTHRRSHRCLGAVSGADPDAHPG